VTLAPVARDLGLPHSELGADGGADGGALAIIAGVSGTIGSITTEDISAPLKSLLVAEPALAAGSS